jgi:WD40 repeat protein
VDKTVQVWDARPGPDPVALKGFTETIRGVACHPDGRRLALACQVSGGHQADYPSALQSTVEVWDSQTRRPVREFSYPGRVARVAFAADGRRLFAVGEDGAVRAWDPDTGEPASPPGPPPPGEDAALVPCPDGRRAAAVLDRWVWLVERQPGPEELARRRAWCRPDAAWHAAKAAAAVRDRDWRAAAFHLNWSLPGSR